MNLGILAIMLAAPLASGHGRWAKMSLPQRADALSGIAYRCGLPRKAIRLVEREQILFQPNPASTYEHVDCALAAIKKIEGFRHVGFVGNEAPDPDHR